MGARLRTIVVPLIGLALFVAALEVLRGELRAVSWASLSSALTSVPPSRVIAAVVLTVLNYGILAGYDFIAFAYAGTRLPPLRIAATSMLAYAVANNIGFAMLSGASVRYRFYARWGITAAELSRIVVSYSVTFWLGLLALGGLSLVLSPLPHELGTVAVRVQSALGVGLLGVSVAYVAVAASRPRPIRIRDFVVPFPSGTIALLQFAVSAADWAIAGAVLYVLLPPGPLSFLTFLGAFLAAQLLGLASHVPGGVGVFETLMVLLLKPFLPVTALMPALIAYRAIYYLLPLSLALVALVADEVHQRRAQVVRASVFVGRLTEQLLPRTLALATFAAGLVLLFSGATPAAADRLAVLARVLPLGVIETSHFAGSLAGAALLLLSHGLSRRLDAAYSATALVLIAGIAVSLLKGADYEEALILTVLLAALRAARPAFVRKAAFFATRFSSAWIGAVAAAILASVWLGLFAFEHVEYSRELWWQFERDADASRFLRGSVGASTLVLLVAIARLIRRAPHVIVHPSDDELDQAAIVIAAQRSTMPFLVYLRDKAVLFDESRQAFVMYAVQGRTWVALGDPVGPAEHVPGLIRTFLETCDDFDGTPVFYEVGTRYLHHYADFGLTFAKLGEEARVDLERFTVDGSAGSKFRQAVNRLDKEGATFRLLAPADVDAALAELRAISDDWLAAKAGAEKGFSLGFFDPDYLKRFPVAVIERGGRIVAFANVWFGPGQHELSIDLMRHQSEAPGGVMDALLVHLMREGQRRGYRWFSLGMAPMSGFDASSVSPLWTRAGSFLYQHGESLYHFQGLRRFKDKFNPVWEPRYLVYPGGLRLPRIAADASALVAGGYRAILTK
jgi:phosphatidylglycerol lysyltransferase